MVIQIEYNELEIICQCLDDCAESLIKQGNTKLAREYYNLIDKVLYSGTIRQLDGIEWKEWKKNPNRDPICILYKDNTTPLWITKPYQIDEDALLEGRIKLFNKRPTNAHIKFAKWKGGKIKWIALGI